MRSKSLLLAAALVAGLPAAAAAQLVPDTALTYRREVFHYRRDGRADPFRSLTRGSEVGVRPEDLALRGVVYTPDPRGSVAVLVRRGAPRPIRARVGDRFGGVRVVAIGPRSVDVVVEEFGIPRRTTLALKSVPKKGEPS